MEISCMRCGKEIKRGYGLILTLRDDVEKSYVVCEKCYWDFHTWYSTTDDDKEYTEDEWYE